MRTIDKKKIQALIEAIDQYEQYLKLEKTRIANQKYHKLCRALFDVCNEKNEAEIDSISDEEFKRMIAESMLYGKSHSITICEDPTVLALIQKGWDLLVGKLE